MNHRRYVTNEACPVPGDGPDGKCTGCLSITEQGEVIAETGMVPLTLACSEGHKFHTEISAAAQPLIASKEK